MALVRVPRPCTAAHLRWVTEDTTVALLSQGQDCLLPVLLFIAFSLSLSLNTRVVVDIKIQTTEKYKEWKFSFPNLTPYEYPLLTD